jgi:hypothetical protein
MRYTTKNPALLESQEFLSFLINEINIVEKRITDKVSSMYLMI